VVEAARIGAHKYLLKPVSTKSLHDRIVAIIGQPRRPCSSMDTTGRCRGGRW
jgi:DNA-binding response OmpR family regulator